MALEVREIRKHFGGVQALRGVSFDVAPGECVALIGPNGAGKSTTFACIAGQLGLSAGHIRWCGQDLARLGPAQRLQRGVARTFQVAQVFEALTVWQNLALLVQAPAGLSAWRALRPVPGAAGMAATSRDARVQTLLEQAGLLEQASSFAGELPYGDRKRLELAIALAGISAHTAEGIQAPRLLLLDEPAAGLAAAERHALMRRVLSLVRSHDAAAPMSVLYTEHNMDAVFGVADRVLVLMEGTLVAQGSAADVAGNALVRQRYLGSVRHTGALEPCNV